mgnify:CR=1 FL=1
MAMAKLTPTPPLADRGTILQQLRAGMTARVVVGCMLGLLLASWSFTHMQAAVYRADNPAFVTQLPISDGLAKGELAVKMFSKTLEQRRTPDALPDAATIALAKQAVAQEPLSANAIAILGIGSADADRRLRLLELASIVDKRNYAAQSRLVLAYAQRQRIGDILHMLDRIFKSHPDQRKLYFPALISVIAAGQDADVLAALFQAEPAWADQFFGQAGADRAASENAAKLRLSLAGYALTRPLTDRVMIQGLADAGHFAQAVAFYRAVRAGKLRSALGPDEQGGGAPLDYPPLDWVFVDTGSRSAGMSADRGISVRLAPGDSGSLGRRLIAMPPGIYQGKATILPVSDNGGQLEARLQISCAEAGVVANQLEIVIGSANPAERQVTIPPGICRYFWVALHGSALRSPVEVDAVIRDLVLIGRSPSGGSATIRLS